jgi:IS4 transposase
VLVRINPQSFVAFSAKGARVALSARLQGLSRAGRTGQWPVVLHGPRSSFSGRVCAVRKSELAIQLAHRRLHRRSSKKQIRTRPETLEFAKYVVVFTTRSIGSAEEILQLYPMRWQIELAFKRTKSLARLSHLPKYDDRSSCAWLYGKLFVALLAQKTIRVGRDISPSGTTISPCPIAQSFGANSASRFIRYRTP